MARLLNLTEEEQKEVLSVVDFYNDEDMSVRQRQIISWKRFKLFWEGINNIYFSATAHDWRVWDQLTGTDSENNDQAYYDKRINVFRAYLESIIAALSIVVPPIKCFPDDAENALDLSTAKAGDKISELIYRHNDAPLLWLHALFIFATEGMVACHTYSHKDKSYGTYSEDITEETTEVHEVTKCPNCGFTIEDNPLSPEEAAIPEPEVPLEVEPELPPMEPMDVSEDEQMLMGLENELGIAPPMPNEGIEDVMGQDVCPSCKQLIIPEVRRENINYFKVIGTKTDVKSRVCIDMYGGLYVKVPNYARTQRDLPYLILEKEINVVMAIQKYEKLKGRKVKDLLKNIKGQGGQLWDEYEQWGRLSPQYRGEFPENVVTERQVWLRPAAFNYLEEDKADKYKELAPKGMLVKMVGESFCEACEEDLDEKWTLINNPMSDYIHFDPLGSSLTSIQEITVDFISLIIQTVEHGIGQTFADPNVLDFKAYEQTEVLPGGIFPAIPKSGKSLQEAFTELKTATLSQEVMPFFQQVQSLGQLTSGALPSLFGGQLEGSETASEYSMSKAQALQRLQNVWKTFTTWWKYCMGKSVNLFIEELETDERNVERRKDGSFFNVFIKRAELAGKIGKVELEANENLPLTWSQQKDVIMTLLQSSSPIIQQFIMAPENLPIIREAIGLTDFFVPGENDIEEEYEEIQLLLESQPIPNQMAMDPMAVMNAELMGQPIEPFTSSVPVKPEIDNHTIRYEIGRAWLISPAGREAKINNKAGYENVLLHVREHLIEIVPPAEDMATEGNGAVPEEKPNQTNKKNAPINGENDVATIQ